MTVATRSGDVAMFMAIQGFGSSHTMQVKCESTVMDALSEETLQRHTGGGA